MRLLFSLFVLLILFVSAFAQKDSPNLNRQQSKTINPLRSDAVLTVGDWALWFYDNGSIASYDE